MRLQLSLTVLFLFAFFIPVQSDWVQNQGTHWIDPVLEIIWGNQSNDLVNFILSNNYPEDIKNGVNTYIKRYKEYDDKTREVPPFTEFVNGASSGKKHDMEHSICAFFDEPAILKHASHFVDNIVTCYEWEGASEPPLSEARSFEQYLISYPTTPIKPYINILLLGRYAAVLDAYIYETLGEKKREYNKINLKRDLEDRDIKKLMNKIDPQFVEVQEKYRKVYREIKNIQDPLLKYYADIIERRSFENRNYHPLFDRTWGITGQYEDEFDWDKSLVAKYKVENKDNVVEITVAQSNHYYTKKPAAFIYVKSSRLAIQWEIVDGKKVIESDRVDKQNCFKFKIELENTVGKSLVLKYSTNVQDVITVILNKRLERHTRHENVVKVPTSSDTTEKSDVTWEKVRGKKWDGRNMSLSNPSELQEKIDNAKEGDVIEISAGEYVGSLAINKKKGLTLKGKPGKTWIYIEDSASDVMIVNESENIKIIGLGFYHKTIDPCVGDVLKIHNVRNLEIKICDISGCGSVGLNITNCQSIVVQDSNLHDCSTSAVNLYSVKDVVIKNNVLWKNRDLIKRRLLWGEVDIDGNEVK